MQCVEKKKRTQGETVSDLKGKADREFAEVADPEERHGSEKQSQEPTTRHDVHCKKRIFTFNLLQQQKDFLAFTLTCMGVCNIKQQSTARGSHSEVA